MGGARDRPSVTYRTPLRVIFLDNRRHVALAPSAERGSGKRCVEGLEIDPETEVARLSQQATEPKGTTMAATQKVSTDQVLDALAARPEVSAAELAAALGLGQSTAAKHLAALESAGTARREPGGREAGRRLPDRWTATGSDAGSTLGVRLSRGALGAMVRDYLAARPNEDLGPTQVAKGLAEPSGIRRNVRAFLLVSVGIGALDLYYLTQRLGA